MTFWAKTGSSSRQWHLFHNDGTGFCGYARKDGPKPEGYRRTEKPRSKICKNCTQPYRPLRNTWGNTILPSRRPEAGGTHL